MFYVCISNHEIFENISLQLLWFIRYVQTNHNIHHQRNTVDMHKKWRLTTRCHLFSACWPDWLAFVRLNLCFCRVCFSSCFLAIKLNLWDFQSRNLIFRILKIKEETSFSKFSCMFLNPNNFFQFEFEFF